MASEDGVDSEWRVAGGGGATMTRDPILWPAVAMVTLTFVIWCVMYMCRIAEIHRSRIDPQDLATRHLVSARLTNVTAADNFQNLLEVPVLFYVICLLLAITGEVTPVQVALAWIYFVLRAVHSLIHVTYNRVMHRFVVYLVSTFCLWAMWGVFAVNLASGRAA